MRRPTLRACLIAPVLFAIACATQGGDVAARPDIGTVPDPEESILKGARAETSPDGLVRIEAPASTGLVFMKAPRPHLQRYSRMMLGNVRIEYKEHAPSFDKRTDLALREGLRENLRKEIMNREMWELTDEPGPDVLLVRVSLLETDVRPDLGGSGSGSSTTFASASGGAVLVLEVLSSIDPEPLVRIIQRRGLKAGVYSGADVDYGRLKQGFREFAANAAATLHGIHEGQRQIAERERQREAQR